MVNRTKVRPSARLVKASTTLKSDIRPFVEFLSLGKFDKLSILIEVNPIAFYDADDSNCVIRYA